MGLMTGAEYVQTLRERRINLRLLGERIRNPVDHPIIRPSINSVAKTYDVAHVPEFEELATAVSHLTGEKINRFNHIHQSTRDLIRKVKLLRLLGQETGTCFQRCVGMDSLNALSIVTFEMDQKLHTEYNRRFLSFLKRVQRDDLMCCGAMTDPKGDRSLRPSQQADPDLYLRIVESTDEGLTVKGAKLHQTGGANSHEIIVMPTRKLLDQEKEYAVSFAVPSDTEGLIYIYGRQSCDLRKLGNDRMDLGNAEYSGQEVLIVFDNVFVPQERVFMAGEFEFAWPLVNAFSAYHRQSYGGCKAGVGDVLVGAAATAAEYNGVKEAPHIRDKIVEMNHLNETMYSCGLACSAEGEKTPSGTCLVHILLSNICKHNVTRFPFSMARLAEDIAGGLMVTLPSEKDLRNPESGPYLEKYLKGVAPASTESRLRILRLIENMVMGYGAVGFQVESLHGAGSPQAQRIMIEREIDLTRKQKLAKSLAGIKEQKE
jgi:4-hydroxybutyryl-CoA dehydratase/vinylacetyl-CoA-Delta-isomerase